MEYLAFQVSETSEGKWERKIVTLNTTKPESGKVMIRVHYSSLNYKDYLSAHGNKGVTKKYPHVPGIDAAGVVIESSCENFSSGDEVVVTGYDLGMNTPGGFGEIITVPEGWVVPKPKGLTLEETMIYGTAGFTAAQCVEAVIRSTEENLVDLKSAPIAVTGSGGGVGSMVVILLEHLGYSVAPLTRNPDDDFLKKISLSSSQSLSEWQTKLDERKPLLPTQWSSAIDTVGGKVLSDLIKTCQYRGTIACCGMVAGIELHTTVFPFILRGIRLIGIDSAECPLILKKKIWEKLSDPWKPSNLHEVKTVIGLKDLEEALQLMKEGKNRGRVVIQHGLE